MLYSLLSGVALSVFFSVEGSRAGRQDKCAEQQGKDHALFVFHRNTSLTLREKQAR